VLGLLATSSALAQFENATVIASARATGKPSVSFSAVDARGQVVPNRDPEYANTIRGVLPNTDWLFLANNTLLVVKETELLLALRLTPGIDGSSWQVSHSQPIGSATYSISGLVRRGMRNGANGAFNPNQGVADLLLTTVSVIGHRSSARLLIPLTFDTASGSSGGVIDTTTFTTTGAQGGGSSTTVTTGDGGTSGSGTTDADGVHRPRGWGVRLWPVPWG
jgi:hypothetical protein